MKTLQYMTAFLLLVSVAFSSFAKKIKITRNIEYQSLKGKDEIRNKLDVYAPVKTDKNTAVFVFIHGGSWNSGNKNLYKFIGKRMARQGKVAVIINYRLAAETEYKGMIADCEQMLQWTYNHIGEYGGNKNKITVSGHSAGGHLAASLAVADIRDYESGQSILSKCVLIDAFGLDIYSYLKHYHTKSDSVFMKTFSTDPKVWKEGSPIYSLQYPAIPYLIFYGTKTYPAIQGDSKKYYDLLNSHSSIVELVPVKGKKHIGMILQMYRKNNILYKRIIPFLEQ